MAHGRVDWFQIDTDTPEDTQRFYGELLNWTFAPDPGSTEDYRLVMQEGAEGPQGGVFNTEGNSPNRAIFFVTVTNVAAATKQAETLGGKVVTAPKTTLNGLTFATLQDPSGNHFGVYSPPGN